jgi:hypothetical protein
MGIGIKWLLMLYYIKGINFRGKGKLRNYHSSSLDLIN